MCIRIYHTYAMHMVYNIAGGIVALARTGDCHTTGGGVTSVL